MRGWSFQATTTLRFAKNSSVEPASRGKFLAFLRKHDGLNLLAPHEASAAPFSLHRFPSCRFNRNVVQYIEQIALEVLWCRSNHKSHRLRNARLAGAF